MRINVSEARSKLPELIERVAGGEEVTLTRHGVPVAVLVGPQVLRRRKAAAAINRAEELHARMLAARERPPSDEGLLSAEWAEERIAEIRHDRDSW